MSLTDQAFIRVYHADAAISGSAPSMTIDVGMSSAVPPPHAKFGNSVAAKSERAETTVAEPKFAKNRSTAHATATGLSAAHGAVMTSQSPKASLSSFAAGNTTSSKAIKTPKPVWEVDSVRWPAACESLWARHAKSFEVVAARLRHESMAGSKVTAITGIARGDGRTTLVLSLARALAAGDLRLVLVDADFQNPRLAEQLGLGVDRGWETVIAGDESLWEVMVEAVADRFSLVPLAKSVAADDIESSTFRIAADLSELAEQFDIVLIDAGPLGDEANHWTLQPASGVQSVILAHDVRRGEASPVAAACLQIADAGQRQLGIAEMFVAQK